MIDLICAKFCKTLLVFDSRVCERDREREGEKVFYARNTWGLDQDNVGRQELDPGLPCGWQETKDFGPSTAASQAIHIISRKLDVKKGWDSIPGPPI